MTKKTEFQVTIGYKAVVCFDIKAEDAETAKKIALEKVTIDGIYKDGQIMDETYWAAGTLDMDKSWNMVSS